MDIKSITNNVSGIVRKVLGKLKETLSLPYAKTYIISSILMILIISVLIFPYGMLLRNKIQKLDKKYLSSIYVGNIEASLIDVTIIDSIHAVLKNSSEIALDDIILNPALNPYTLLYRNNIKTDIQISKLNYKSPKAEIKLKVNGNIDLLMDSNFNKVIEGNIKLIIQNALLKIPEVKIPSPMGEMPLTLPDIRITSINFNSSIANSELKIIKFSISGQDLKGDITGSIKIAGILSNSTLDILLNIDPESKVLEDYKDFLTGFINQKGKLSIPIQGTFSRPRVNMKGTAGKDMGGEIPVKTGDKPEDENETAETREPVSTKEPLRAREPVAEKEQKVETEREYRPMIKGKSKREIRLKKRRRREEQID